MTNKNFNTAILVDQKSGQVFNAINNVKGWWSEHVTGNTNKLGDEFVFEVKGVHWTKQKLVEVVPGKKIVWLVTESDMMFVNDNREWLGTKIIFEINEKGKKTELIFTHEGLVPEIECYDACSPAWTEYIQHSLRQLIETGKGDPNLEGRKIREIKS